MSGLMSGIGQTLSVGGIPSEEEIMRDKEKLRQELIVEAREGKDREQARKESWIKGLSVRPRPAILDEMDDDDDDD